MGFFSSGGRQAVGQGVGLAGVAGQAASKQIGIDQGLQQGYRKTGDTTANSLFTLPANGGLNPYLSQQFAREKEQIGKTYGDQVAAAQRGLTQRGMSVAPTGLTASIQNTAIRNAGDTETGAYNDQLKNQLGLGLQGVNYAQQQQQLYDPLKAVAATDQSAQTLGQLGALKQQMGSGFGDVLKAAGTILPAFSGGV